VPRWAAAASIVATCVLSLVVWVSLPREAFSEQLVAHIEGEAKSLIQTTESWSPSACIRYSRVSVFV
jgi:hypothetical protein